MAECINSSCNILDVLSNNLMINNYDNTFSNCTTCSLLVKQNSCTVWTDLIESNTDGISLCKILYLVCPELDLRQNSKAILCVNCFEIINTMDRFICKCYISNEKLNRNFYATLPSLSNFYSFKDYSFDIKNKIKLEEIDLSEIESPANIDSLCLATTDKTFTMMQKYNSKTVSDCNYNSNPSLDFPLHICINSGEKQCNYNYSCIPKNNYTSSYKGHLTNTHTLASEKPFECSYCDYRCNRKKYLAYHIRTHSGKKPFICSQCDYRSNRKLNLMNHIYTHTGEKPFKCLYCDYSSSQKNNLTTHIRVHTGKKPFKCSYCDFSSSYKIHLSSHIRTHTGEKPFKCLHCNYCSSYKIHLIYHIRTHTGERPFKCSFCDYSSSQKNNLTTHIRIHTGKKPFKCSHCDYSSSYKMHLTNHIRTHTGEKPFKCSYCNYSSSQRITLKTHIRVHTQEKPFKCFLCDYSSSQKGTLINHMRVHNR